MENEPRTTGPNLLAGAAVLYGTLLLAALIWSFLRGLELSFFGDDARFSVALGLVGTIGLLTLGWLGSALLPAAKQLAQEMAETLVNGTGTGALILIALLSGVCEEVFFRGVLQQEFGLVAASLVFGLVHFVPERRFFLWTVYAIVAGFFLGWLYEVTNGLAAPVTAHVLNNAVVLLYWRHRLEKSVRRSEDST
ncbi:MAG: CPBP family intramembrane glutamic endopeptidase [Rubrobacter sp.]